MLTSRLNGLAPCGVSLVEKAPPMRRRPGRVKAFILVAASLAAFSACLLGGDRACAAARRALYRAARAMVLAAPPPLPARRDAGSAAQATKSEHEHRPGDCHSPAVLAAAGGLRLVPGDAGPDRAGAAPATSEPTPCRLRLGKLAAFKPLPVLVGPGECGAADAVLLESVTLPDDAKVTLTPPATLRCTMAEQVALWLREDVLPASASLGHADARPRELRLV